MGFAEPWKRQGEAETYGYKDYAILVFYYFSHSDGPPVVCALISFSHLEDLEEGFRTQRLIPSIPGGNFFPSVNVNDLCYFSLFIFVLLLYIIFFNNVYLTDSLLEQKLSRESAVNFYIIRGREITVSFKKVSGVDQIYSLLVSFYTTILNYSECRVYSQED